MRYKKITALALTAILSVSFFGCSGGAKSEVSSSEPVSSSSEASADGQQVQKVLIGIRQDLYPTSYIDEQGEPSGYDIDIAREIDALLPEYEFEYEAVSQEALLTGLDTGKYKAAVAGFYSNDERREKYLFPEECIGGNIIGLVAGKEHADLVDLEDVYETGASLEPIATTSGMYGIVVKYNNENPDKQVTLEDSDWTDAAVLYKWIADGRYDVAVTSKNVFDETVANLGLEDKLVFNSFTAIKTWSLFNPEETELAAAYDRALAQLKENGLISQKSEEYFGEDIIPFITEE